MNKPYQVISDITVLPAHFPIPGTGFLPINAYVIKSKEPVLIDTGMGIDSEEFMKALKSVIDPMDLRWIWLTHDDADHIGSIRKVLEAAPKAKLVANSLAILRMSTTWSVPMQRVHWLNPGDSINAGDRSLTAVRPPLFDNPTTIGVYDSKSATFFSADCFGAPPRLEYMTVNRQRFSLPTVLAQSSLLQYKILMRLERLISNRA
jgi:flavorubredoxin